MKLLHLKIVCFLSVTLSACTPGTRENNTVPPPENRAENNDLSFKTDDAADAARFQPLVDLDWILVLEAENPVSEQALAGVITPGGPAIGTLGLVVLGDLLDTNLQARFGDQLAAVVEFDHIPAQLTGLRQLPSLYQRQANGKFSLTLAGASLTSPSEH